MPPERDDDELIPMQDAQTAADFRFLIRGLRDQLGVDPEDEVPPDFQATVMARMQTLPLPRRGFLEQMQVVLPRWAPALVAILVLSLGVNVWWGLHAFGPAVRETHRVADTRRDWLDTVGPLTAYRFQAGIQHPTALGPLVAARPTPSMPADVAGFALHVPPSTFVLLGTRYADALAALQGGEVATAGAHLEVLEELLVGLQTPSGLTQYLQEMQSQLRRQAYDPKTLAQFVALFAPLYQELYAKDPRAQPWVLFQTGAWLEALALAAEVGDTVAVQHGEEPLAALQRALRQLPVPSAVYPALAQLQARLASPDITAVALHEVGMQVEALQKMLSH